MSVEANKEVVRRFFEWESRLAAGEDTVDRATEELLTDDFRAHVPGLTNLDADTFCDVVVAFAEGFPGFQVIVEEQFAEGDRVATRAIFAGTNSGEYNGLPPTGRDVAVPEIVVHRFEDGKIAELWVQFDNLAIMNQLEIPLEQARGPR
jgi:predicted ester cyclase